jgi:hypothetical protein
MEIDSSIVCHICMSVFCCCQDDEAVGFPGHPADSGVGESVGSCNLVGKDSSYFTRSVTLIVTVLRESS